MNHLLLYDGKEFPQGVAYAECHNAYASDLRMLKEYNQIQPVHHPELVCVACSKPELFTDIIEAHSSRFNTIFVSKLPDYRGQKPREVNEMLMIQNRLDLGADIQDEKPVKSAEVPKAPIQEQPKEEIKAQEAPEDIKPSEPVKASEPIKVPAKKEKAPMELKITRKKK